MRVYSVIIAISSAPIGSPNDLNIFVRRSELYVSMLRVWYYDLRMSLLNINRACRPFGRVFSMGELILLNWVVDWFTNLRVYVFCEC